MTLGTNIQRYTQETQFKQAIQGPIAALWQQRQEGFINNAQKKRLYWCKLTNPNHHKAIFIVNGRIESCWKYQELFFECFQQGFDVYSFDHQGQGLSERLLPNNMGHVLEFDHYVNDLKKIVALHDWSGYQQCFLLGQSMGGTIATRYLQTNIQHPFSGLALSAPMLDINLPSLLRPIGIPVSQLLATLSITPRYAPSQGDYYPKPFAGNLITNSEVRYQWFRQLYQDKPELQVAGASTRWLWQSLMAARQCYLHTRQLSIPTLLIQGGADRIVSNQAQFKFIQKLQKTNLHSQLVTITAAKHELWMEQDQYRNQALEQLFKFMQ